MFCLTSERTTHCTHKDHDPPATPPHTSLLMQLQDTEHLPHAHLTAHRSEHVSLVSRRQCGGHITKNTLQQIRGREEWTQKCLIEGRGGIHSFRIGLHSCTITHLGHHKMVMVSQVTAAPSEQLNKERTSHNPIPLTCPDHLKPSARK